jgi:hypothetical protein
MEMRGRFASGHLKELKDRIHEARMARPDSQELGELESLICEAMANDRDAAGHEEGSVSGDSQGRPLLTAGTPPRDSGTFAPAPSFPRSADQMPAPPRATLGWKRSFALPAVSGAALLVLLMIGGTVWRVRRNIERQMAVGSRKSDIERQMAVGSRKSGTGDLRVLANVAGAKIFIDGQDSGQVSPYESPICLPGRTK